ncbi:putative extracellular tungstate binding protein [Acephala macrosclerotiorum]|nr:putative extracellular tungstate binding protein [Acephala macrosclerotiorum]
MEVYDGSESPVHLRIGNGGAGQSGLVRALSDAFIKQSPRPPFKIAWFESDTTESILYLKEDVVDIAITYNKAAEQLAIKQGIAKDHRYYAFRDHFLLVGPPSNPAGLDKSQDIHEMFSQIYTSAESGDTDPPVRFLSRFDKSATNLKESELWIETGQVPWATKKSPWYHEHIAYPIQALEVAAALQEYTLTDLGTYLSVSSKVESQLTIYKKGTDSSHDPLLLPAHILVSCKAQNVSIAEEFARWVTSLAGQLVIRNFKKKDQRVYSGALDVGRAG